MTFVISIIGVALYMAHFWVPMPIAELVLWPIASFCAIFSIYGGIIGRTRADDNHEKGRLTVAAVIGGHYYSG